MIESPSTGANNQTNPLSSLSSPHSLYFTYIIIIIIIFFTLIHIKGDFAYGWMLSEAGVHRLVRISQYDSSRRRHTCFAQVAVFPDADSQSDTGSSTSSHQQIVIPVSDLKIETFRASGKGGQHVNRTESAVRITHIPSGIVASCQSERSQHQNRESAMSVIKARLLARKSEEKANERAQIKATLGDNTWGNQIRSYVLNPYQMIKDHRTDYEIKGDNNTISRLLNEGDPSILNHFMKAYLLQRPINL